MSFHTSFGKGSMSAPEMDLMKIIRVFKIEMKNSMEIRINKRLSVEY